MWLWLLVFTHVCFGSWACKEGSISAYSQDQLPFTAINRRSNAGYGFQGLIRKENYVLNFALQGGSLTFFSFSESKTITMDTTADIAVLPMEVLLAILSWIPPIDIVKRVKPVCKDWQRMCHFQDSLWGQWFRIFFPSCFDLRQKQRQKGNDNDEDLWPCSACTFLNKFSTTACVACLTEIPEIYASLHIGKKAAQEEVLADEAAKLIGPINQLLAIVLHSDLVCEWTKKKKEHASYYCYTLFSLLGSQQVVAGVIRR